MKKIWDRVPRQVCQFILVFLLFHKIKWQHKNLTIHEWQLTRRNVNQLVSKVAKFQQNSKAISTMQIKEINEKKQIRINWPLELKTDCGMGLKEQEMAEGTEGEQPPSTVWWNAPLLHCMPRLLPYPSPLSNPIIYITSPLVNHHLAPTTSVHQHLLLGADLSFDIQADTNYNLLCIYNRVQPYPSSLFLTQKQDPMCSRAHNTRELFRKESMTCFCRAWNLKQEQSYCLVLVMTLVSPTRKWRLCAISLRKEADKNWCFLQRNKFFKTHEGIQGGPRSSLPPRFFQNHAVCRQF